MIGGAATGGRRWLLVGTVLAWAALVLFVAGVTLGLVAVKNRVAGRTAQDCGAPAAFMLSGRQDVRVVPGGKLGLTSSQATGVNRHGCRSLVARRAIPAGALFLATLAVGTVAFALTLHGRRQDRADPRSFAAWSPEGGYQAPND